MTFLLCDPGWCVYKSDVQDKWDNNTHTQPINDSPTQESPSSRADRAVKAEGEEGATMSENTKDDRESKGTSCVYIRHEQDTP